MKIIEPSTTIETPIHGEHGLEILRALERAARTCYKSECKITADSAPEFVRKLVRIKKHESVIEHESATVRFIVDRGVSHELVRHRIAAFSQESTRYCNYSQEKFGSELAFIRPCFWLGRGDMWAEWEAACQCCEVVYNTLISLGASPQEARSVLPNSLKTEVVMTANMREWRHVFRMRCSPQAHPQMRQVMIPLLAEFKQHLEPLFGDIEV